jgi:hypothetical protein
MPNSQHDHSSQTAGPQDGGGKLKRPSFQFYPGDWLRDPVSGCSLAAQGLWLRMMIVAHDSECYGHLSQNGTPMPPDSIARRCGCESVEQYSSLISELREAGVPSRTPEGIIFSRRMVRDEALRDIRASGGSESLKKSRVQQPKNNTSKDTAKDGRKDIAKDGGKDTPDQSQNEPSGPSLGVSPSSSSSASSSPQKVKTSCAAPSKSDGTAQQPVQQPVITLTLNDKSEYPITETRVEEWRNLYPGVDVMQELRNMRGWLSANPERVKTQRGVLRFAISWLQNSQDRRPRPGGNKDGKHINRAEQQTRDNLEAVNAAFPMGR